MEDRLQKFARVAEIGNITKAADELHISQPALSTAIHKLERELKTQLIKHTGRTIEITPAGLRVYQTASEIRTKLQILDQELAKSRHEKPQVRVGMIDSLAELLCIAGDLLQRLDRIASTSLTVNNSSYLVAAVMHGKLDIALVAGEPHTANSLTIENVGSESLILVTSSSRSDEVRRRLQKGALADFLAYNPTSNTYRLINLHLANSGLQTHVIFHSTSPEVILQLVIASRGTAVLPFQMVSEHIRSGALVQLLPETINRLITAVTSKERRTSEAVDLCIKHVRRSLAQVL